MSSPSGIEPGSSDSEPRPSGSGVPENVAARNQMLYEHFRISEERQMEYIQAMNRREAVFVYENMAELFGQPVEIFGKPVKIDIEYDDTAEILGDLITTEAKVVGWSPASLKELAGEVLRRKIFIDEWADNGGMARFGKGHRSKFDTSVLRRIAGEAFVCFQVRIKQWLALNPRPSFPALPESLPWDESSSVSVDSLGALDTWSIDDVVKNHRFYVESPNRPENPDGGATRASGNPAKLFDEADSDSSVEILQVKKKSDK